MTQKSSSKKAAKKKPESTGEKRDDKGRFVPGVSGNPAGRPEGSVSITAAIKAALGEVPEGEQKTRLAQMVEVMFEKALRQGDDAVLRMIWNYVDGLPSAKVDIGVDRQKLQELTEFFRGVATGNYEQNTLPGGSEGV